MMNATHRQAELLSHIDVTDCQHVRQTIEHERRFQRSKRNYMKSERVCRLMELRNRRKTSK